MITIDENCFGSTEDAFAFYSFAYIRESQSYANIMRLLKSSDEYTDILKRISGKVNLKTVTQQDIKSTHNVLAPFSSIKQETFYSVIEKDEILSIATKTDTSIIETRINYDQSITQFYTYFDDIIIIICFMDK